MAAPPIGIAKVEPLGIAKSESLSPPTGRRGRSLGGFASNAATSGGALLANTVQAITSPIQTGSTMLDIATGLVRKMLPEDARANHPLALRGEATADAMIQYFTQRYGSVEGLKEAAYTDPVGVLADVSTVLTMGGGAATKLGTLSRLGRNVVKAGELAQRTGNAIDPLRAITAAARPALEATATGIVEGTVRPPAAVKRQQKTRWETSRTIREEHLLSEAGARARGKEVSALARQAAADIPRVYMPTNPMLTSALNESLQEAAKRTGQVVESETAALDELARINRDVPPAITPEQALQLRQNSDRLSTQYYKHQDALLPTSPVGMQGFAQAKWGNELRNWLRSVSPEVGSLSDRRRRLMLAEAALETAGDRPHALTRMLGAGTAGLGNPVAGAGIWAMDSPLVGTSVASVLDAIAQLTTRPELRQALQAGRITQAGTSGVPR